MDKVECHDRCRKSAIWKPQQKFALEGRCVKVEESSTSSALYLGVTSRKSAMSWISHEEGFSNSAMPWRSLGNGLKTPPYPSTLVANTPKSAMKGYTPKSAMKECPPKSAMWEPCQNSAVYKS